MVPSGNIGLPVVNTGKLWLHTTPERKEIQLRLQATYAKQLGAFNTIIEQNAPFTVLWNLYLESLVDLCDVHHLSPFAVLGMLETTMDQHPFDIIDEPVTMRMNLTDKAARFVEDNPKNITMALMAFTLRTGETSLTKLSYLCQRATNIELGVTAPTVPAVSVPKPEPKPRAKVNLEAALKPKPQQKPTPKPKPQPAPKEDPIPTDLSKRLDALQREASELSKPLDDATEPIIVETNSLLGDFIDL